MPPPTAPDEWLAARRFGIVIDAGSSGSRLQIYSWRDARVVRSEEGPKSYLSLPNVERGTEDPDAWVHKVDPGISTFGEHPEGVAGHLAPLLEHARMQIPPSLQHETPIFLLATAGMRLLPSAQQSAVLNAACNFIRFHSHFRVDSSPSSPCGSSIRIITGEEEGLFGWIAVNYLMDQFTKRDDDQTTYGFLDMGGASTQIAFEPSAEERKRTRGLIDVHLRLIGGEEIHHQVFVTTWLGYGTNQARERYVAKAVQHAELRASAADESAGNHDALPDPCLPQNLVLTENSAYPGHEDAHSKLPHTLIGTGSFERCLKEVAPLLNKDAPCPDYPCLFNGVHVPRIDFAVSHFIGVSEYWYSSEHVFGLGGPYNFVEFERAASDFCSRDWTDILKEHELSKERGALGGDGEVMEHGKVVGIGKWGDKVEISRLQMQCFKSAWLVNVLHDGIGMPRIVDPGGNSTSNPEEVVDKAKQKGLGKPIMQSLDTIDDTAISWTLGKMVLEASREVPPLSKDMPPLSDPAVGDQRVPGDVPVADHDDLKNGASPLFSPQILGEHYMNLSPLSTLLCLVSLLILVIFAYRLRRSMSGFILRYHRRTLKRTDTDNDDRIFLEDGYLPNGGRSTPHFLTSILSTSSSASRYLRSMRSLLSRILASPRQPSATPSSSSMPTARHMPSSTAPASLTRTFSSPALRYQNGNVGTGQLANTYPGSSFPSRSSTPPLYRRDPTQVNAHTSHSLYSQPRSRNSSQLNLTTLVPRQLSRGGSSGQQTPTGAYLDGD